MKIIIIGNGKVGFTLAKQLSGEDHDLVLIDHNAEALRVADSTLDIMCLDGSGASIQILRTAGVREAELVVAVTGSDELNIVCCLIAKKLGARHTVARIRSPEYFREANLLKREIGLNMIINPEYAAAQEISRLLRVPSAFSVETFARGLVEMIGFPIQESDGLAGLSLFEYNKRNPNNRGVLMCAAIRGDEVYVPNGRFVPQVGDKAYVIGSQQEIVQFFQNLGRDSGRLRQITVLGGSRIATYLTWAVEKVGIKVRIVEQSGEKCLALAEKLPKALIIQGDGTSSELIDEEDLLDTDAFIALTNRDEENLLMAMTAQRHGVKKVIAKMTRPNYIEMIREFGVDSVISPKDITANQISAYVRAMARSQGSAVENLYKLLGGAIEAVEFTATETTRFLDTPLKDLRLKPGMLVAAIAREGKTIIPDGSTSIHAGDKVIVMAKSLFLQDLDEILQ
ncbi:MAG: Trk system potassium transporter TrkA [Oscillospiraceae bacterium]|jgi:trk system potassium uptake protein TrkA|nr:Trk system potassium transporter TrkA [Oscillospiraceae bacterium]